MTDKLRQAAQQMLEAVADLTILTPREWQAVHGLKIDALRTALAEQPAEQGLDDGGDVLTIAYLHGFSEGKKATEASQPENVAEDAYNHACEEMKRWQRERRKSGKEVGTTGSLCDGIAWLYQYVDSLERQARNALRVALAEPEPRNQCGETCERQRVEDDTALLAQCLGVLKACRHLLVIDLHRATELQLLSSDKSEKTLNEHDAAITALKERLK